MPLGPQPAGDLQSVHVRQAQVEHDQIDAALQPGVECGRSVLTDLDLVPFPAQCAGQRLRNGRVVLGEQYTGHELMVVRPERGPGRDRQEAVPLGPTCGRAGHAPAGPPDRPPGTDLRLWDVIL